MINVIVEFDYSKLRGKIIEVFGSINNAVEHISFSKSSLSQKLNNKVEFTQSEITELSELLGIDGKEISSYFFTRKV